MEKKDWQSEMIPPIKVGNADLIAWLVLNDGHIRTGNTEHYAGGELMKEFYGLAICKYENDNGYYLFYCNRDWKAVADTWHETMQDAIGQAEFEYTNTENGWTIK